jgi:hypothetical protein
MKKPRNKAARESTSESLSEELELFVLPLNTYLFACIDANSEIKAMLLKISILHCLLTI